MRSVLPLICLVVAFIPAKARADLVLSAGPADFERVTGAVRLRNFRSFAGNEIFLGVPDLGASSNRVAADYTWPSSADVTFSFNPGTSRILATVSGQGINPSINLSYAVNPVSPLDVMQITIVDRDRGSSVGSVAFNNVDLNGTSLGSFTGVEGTFANWKVSDFDFSQAWTLSGTVALSGTFAASQELNRIEVSFGRAVPEPGTFALLAPFVSWSLLRRGRRNRG